MNRRGTSVIELLVVTLLLAWVTVTGISVFRALLQQAEVTVALRLVTAALHTARSTALAEGDAVQASFQSGRIVLSRRGDEGWLPWREWPTAPGVHLQATAKPVFSPLGSASPLCTVEVFVGGHYRRRVTLAISGRVRIQPAP